MPSDPPPREDTYVIDPESGAEMARLINQDRLVAQHVGGLFPSEVDPSTLRSVLDLACGPGGWVWDVAFAYPGIELVGVDISREMVQYARALARVLGLDNVTFLEMNIVNVPPDRVRIDQAPIAACRWSLYSHIFDIYRL